MKFQKTIILFLILVSLSSVSGFLIDNTGDYNEETKTMTITNAFGLGDDITKVTLLSPHVVNVFAGKNRKVAWYGIENYEPGNGEDVFGTIYSYDLKEGGRELDKEFRIKKLFVDEVEVPKMVETCKEGIAHLNGSKNILCTFSQEGTRTEYRDRWEEINKKDILEAGNFTIGLFTDVSIGEIVDWVPKIYGIQIPEWAVWQESFNTGLVAYWDFNEDSGTVAEDSVFSNFNWSTNNMENADWDIGLINSGLHFDNADEHLTMNQNLHPADTNFSLSLWANITDGDSGRMFIRNITGGAGISLHYDGTGNIFAQVEGNSSSRLMVSTNTINLDVSWNHIVMVYNQHTKAMQFYLNNTLQPSSSAVSVLSSGGPVTFGRDPVGADTYYGGMIDEFAFWNRTLSTAEINDLWNNGAGVSRSQGPLVVDLINPADDTTTINSSLTFETNISVNNLNITNATLFIYETGGDLFSSIINNTITGNSTNTTTFTGISIPVGIYDWNVYACGISDLAATSCNFSDNNFTFTRETFREELFTFNNLTSEGNVETIILNITFNNSAFSSPTGNLIYNNTAISTISSGSGGSFIFTANPTAPGVSAATNITFKYSISFFNGSSTNFFNSTLNNQTVLDFNLDNCLTNSVHLLNFSSVDEEEQTALVTNMDVAVNIYNSDKSEKVANFSQTINTTNFAICSDINLSTGTEYSLDTVVKYSAEDYEIEYYNIVDFTINNDTTEQFITLFDLKSNDSTPFRLTFTGGETFLPVENALVYLDRQYVEENVFKTVELPLTDPNGQAVLHMVRNDIIYNIRIIKNGIVLGNFQEISAFCEDPLLQNCQIALSGSTAVSESFNYDNITGLAYPSVPTYNANTSVVSFDFIVTDGTFKTVTMNVTRNDVFGNRTVCEDSLVSASGTLSCSVGSGVTDTTLKTTVTVNGGTIVISTINIDSLSIGSVGYVIWFILSLVLIFAFGESKNGVLASLLISFIGAILLGLSSGSLLGFGAAGTWLLIIVVLGIWRLNKDRQQ